MFDLGISKLTLIGIVALMVVGPEKLPGIARTLGTLLGRAQRYINNFKAEMGNMSGLHELREMQQTVTQTAYDLEREVHGMTRQVQQIWPHAYGAAEEVEDIEAAEDRGYWRRQNSASTSVSTTTRKNWRLRRTALPHWYKARHGIRTRALSGAARAARIKTPTR